MTGFTRSDSPHTTVRHLQNLVLIRTLVLLCLIISLTFSFWWAAPLPYTPLLLVLLALVLLNGLTYWRMKLKLPITDIELFTQLLADLACLSVAFYFSGGANNPFVFYFLVPICISATTLSWSYTWIITILCIASYSILLFFHVPLPLLAPDTGHHAAQPELINLHILGMWINFFISAVLITFFVVKMARDLRRQEQQLNRRIEDELRNEQVMAVATLAAGTAHELATPLSTMKVTLGELRAEYSEPAALHNDLLLLAAQVEQCARTLKQLVNTAEKTRSTDTTSQFVREFCQHIIERWQVMRPEACAKIYIDDSSPIIKYAFPPTIAQSIINLLNNAADANPEDIIINVGWTAKELHWKIEDNGTGIPLELSDQLGKAFITTKGSGLGLGLFLTHATLNRYGGKVHLFRRKPRGTVTEVKFPFAMLDQ